MTVQLYWCDLLRKINERNFNFTTVYDLKVVLWRTAQERTSPPREELRVKRENGVLSVTLRAMRTSE